MGLKKNTTKITIIFFTQDDPYTILTIFLLGRPRLCSGLKIDFWGDILPINLGDITLWVVGQNIGKAYPNS